MVLEKVETVILLVIVATIAVKWIHFICPIFFSSQTLDAVYHVAQQHPAADDANSGTPERPWRTISKAAAIMRPGDRAIVHAGIYREWVNPKNSGTPEALVIYQAAAGEEVILTGADIATGWTHDDAAVWKLDNWTTRFMVSPDKDYSPSNDRHRLIGTRIYVKGNHGPNWPVERAGNDWNIGFWDLDVWEQTKRSVNAKEADYRINKPFPAPAVTTHEASELEARILPNVGATKPRRDAVDTRIVKEVRSCTGKLGPSSGYPVLVGTPAPADTDNDGMPDAWETAHGLNPKNPADGPAVASNGYTNIENYINELAGDLVSGN